MTPDEPARIWPGAVEIKALNWNGESLPRSPDYILLSPDSSARVCSALTKVNSGRPASDPVFPEYLEMKRFPEIDEMKVKAQDGREMEAGEVAESNQDKIAQAARSRWEQGLTELFRVAGIARIPTHSKESGRLTVGVAGGEDGQGVAGLLGFFNRNFPQVPIDLFVVDPRDPGKIEKIKELLAFNVSTVTPREADLREVLWEKVQPDLVVFPNPGPLDVVETYLPWKDIITKIARTKPSFIISCFPRVGYCVRDPLVIQDIVKTYRNLVTGANDTLRDLKEEELVAMSGWTEQDIFRHILKAVGYETMVEKWFNDNLKMPLSVYGAAVEVEGQPQYLGALDPYFLLSVNKSALALAENVGRNRGELK